MIRDRLVSWVKGSELAVALIGVGPVCAAQVASTDRSADPRDAMITALAARSPDPSLGEEGRTFDRLVGAWDCDYTFYLDDGRVLHKSGEVLFGWIIDGRALQDVWITYPADGQTGRTIGTSLRFFDTALKQWRVFFTSPRRNYVVNVQGGREGERIVLHGSDVDGSQIRWSFNEITAGSFTWRGEKSRDGGKTWKLEEEHHMRRHLG